VDGLRIAGPEGLAAAEELIDDGEPGAEFVAMCVALHLGAMKSVARLIDLAAAAPELSRGMVSAMGWAPEETVNPVLRGLVFPKLSPALHYLGVAGHAINRRDPGEALTQAVTSDDLRLRARALRAVGECRRRDLQATLAAQLDDEDPACRFSAAWSGALLGEAAAVKALWELAGADAPVAAAACALAARCTDLNQANERLEGLKGGPPETVLAGMAALGDPVHLPWVLEQLNDDAIARPAAAALSTITGLDLVRAKLDTRPAADHLSGPNDDPDDEDVAMDPHESLPWPDPARLVAWWEEHQGELEPGVRHLAGRPLAEPWLEEILREGSQPLRAAAALELALRRPTAPLFEVRAPGFRQRRLLAL
jgi:uncharacterized protein (TIGR02270 family)